MALSSQLPVIPVVYSRYYFMDKKTKRFDHGKYDKLLNIYATPQKTLRLTNSES